MGRYLWFPWTKRSGEVNYIKDVAGFDKTDIGCDQVSGSSLELGILACALADRRNSRDAGVLRKLFRTQEFATAGFVVWRRSGETRRRSFRDCGIAQARARSGAGIFIRNAAASGNCA